jgi:hypothetical protein
VPYQPALKKAPVVKKAAKAAPKTVKKKKVK